MRVLLTGGAGYVGSIATERLLDLGHEVLVFDNLGRGHRAAVDARARFVRGDVRTPDELESAFAAFKPEAVMHFAALALVGESMKRPGLYFDNNFAGLLRLAETMRRHDVRRIVFSSTCAVYGAPAVVPMDETQPTAPESPYGESKLMGERLLGWYAQRHGFLPVLLRYFNACGASARHGEDHAPETHLIPNVLRTALGRQARVEIFGDDYETPDGTCIRDYIHVLDLAEAHILALECEAGGTFNLGNGAGYSVQQVIEEARRVTGRPIPVTVRPRRPGDPPRLVASAGEAATRLGWKPQRPSLRTILEDAWAWHRARPDGYGDRATG